MGEMINTVIKTGKEITEKEIKEETASLIHTELNSYCDNPLDSIASGIIDILLDVIHASHRLRNDMYVDVLKTNIGKIQERMEDVNVLLSSIQRLSDDTIEVVKESSFFHDKDNSTFITTVLNEVSSKIPVWRPGDKVVPCHNDLFDKHKLGESSDVYQRMSDMRSLVSKMGNSNDEALRNLQDMLLVLRGQIDQLAVSEESIIIICDKIKQYKLTVSDVKYMISYLTYHKPEHSSGKSKDNINTKIKTHITNFSKSDYKVYLAAVKIYNKFGKCVLSISDEAYDRHNNLLNDHSSLHLLGNRDNFKFSEFDECMSAVRSISEGMNK